MRFLFILFFTLMLISPELRYELEKEYDEILDYDKD